MNKYLPILVLAATLVASCGGDDEQANEPQEAMAPPRRISSSVFAVPGR